MPLNKGYRNKTRKKYRKNPRERGLRSVEKYLIEFDIGDTVDIIGDPSQQNRGLPHRRYHGRTGIITGIRGRCFEVQVKLGNSKKMLIVGREHIRLNPISEKL
ncbi:MAG: 50S ribosomal protein L21e [Candidatus Lokiarchaeota archaeon]|nr:50S ribosomal protein L21e [Candidatus Lokiarchaeota archaeon]MBD3200172.1 50S ribosomal protein L21e [Candidatus Lokiarchaeota archaeon]